ncbi:DUF167 family protein [Jiella marina]|uniref:DUF167 family protein n=1 Tax=Jiella sp. LLJ827 TaxID=2917712 RepID=UPI002101103C|nr:DUF167 family protein [Jiella sp. LLJ827]
MAEPAYLQPSGEDLLLYVRLTPRSSRDAVEGPVADAAGSVRLAVRVSAVPESGKANKALIALVAKTLKLPKSAIAITSGETARQKTLCISGEAANLASVVQRLGS